MYPFREQGNTILKKEKSVYFTVKQGIVTILLSALLIGAVAGAVILRGKTNALRAENTAAVAAAQQQLDEAKAALDALGAGTAPGAEARPQGQDDALAEARTRVRELQEEIAALEEETNRVTAQAEEMEADEDTAYYMAAYNTMKEAMEKVESYIEDD